MLTAMDLTVGQDLHQRLQLLLNASLFWWPHAEDCYASCHQKHWDVNVKHREKAICDFLFRFIDIISLMEKCYET